LKAIQIVDWQKFKPALQNSQFFFGCVKRESISISAYAGVVFKYLKQIQIRQKKTIVLHDDKLRVLFEYRVKYSRNQLVAKNK